MTRIDISSVDSDLDLDYGEGRVTFSRIDSDGVFLIAAALALHGHPTTDRRFRHAAYRANRPEGP